MGTARGRPAGTGDSTPPVDGRVHSPLSRRATVASLLVLTTVTGLVDAMSFLGLGKVFVANMTGNVVFLGFSVDRVSGMFPAPSLVALAGFLCGALFGGWQAVRFPPHPRAWLGLAFGVQGALLGLVATLLATGELPRSGHDAYATIAVMAVAIGMQSSTVRRFAVRDLPTIVVNATLTGLAADSTLAGGIDSRVRRRLASVAALLGGAALGAALVQASPAGLVGLASGLTAAVAFAFAFGGKGGPTGRPRVTHENPSRVPASAPSTSV